MSDVHLLCRLYNFVDDLIAVIIGLIHVSCMYRIGFSVCECCSFLCYASYVYFVYDFIIIIIIIIIIVIYILKSDASVCATQSAIVATF